MAVYISFFAAWQLPTTELLGTAHYHACGESQLNSTKHLSWLLLASQSC
jgi:hypothetical protein